MIKKATIFLIISFSLILCSCSLPGIGTIGNQNTNDPNMATLEDFREGREGIVLEFNEKMPPEQVTSTDRFKAVILLHNKGVTDVDYGKAVLLTTDPNVRVTPTVREFNLRGKNLYVQEGEKKTEEFDIQVSGTGDYQTTFISYTCYPYNTKLVDSMCIDPTIGNVVVADKACEMRDMRFSGGQGAPIAVTGITINPLFEGEGKLRLRLNISVENVGGGKVVGRDITSNECALESYDDDDTNDNVRVEIEVSDARATCRKHLDNLNSQGKSGSIVCTTGYITRQYASRSPVVVDLDYGYVSAPKMKTISIDES